MKFQIEFTQKKYIGDYKIYSHLMINFNREMYEKLWGQSEYIVNGYTSTYEREKLLKKLNCSILYTAGDNDEMTIETIKLWNKKTQNSSYVIFKNSSHIHYIEKINNHVELINNWT